MGLCAIQCWVCHSASLAIFILHEFQISSSKAQKPEQLTLNLNIQDQKLHMINKRLTGDQIKALQPVSLAHLSVQQGLNLTLSCICDSSTQKTEAEEGRAQGQPGQHSKTLTQTQNPGQAIGLQDKALPPYRGRTQQFLLFLNVHV